MKLTDWLTATRKTAAEFATLVGVDKSTATRWENGDTTPRPQQMARIVEVTGGEVTANDFMLPPVGTDDPGQAEPGATEAVA